MIIFVTGGVRSGKSDYAEKRALSLHQGRESQLHYLATNHVYDREMAERIIHHQHQRANSGANWIVWEQPNSLNKLFLHFKKDDVILVDCVTTLVSNELFTGWETAQKKWQNLDFQKETEQKLMDLFTKLAASSCDIVIVSNEVSYDIPTQDAGTELYKRLLGRVHQYIVSLAKEAILVECGIPCWKKGG